MDNLPQNHIKESVLEKIAQKKVVMQPRHLFVLQWIGLTTAASIVLILAVLTLSFVAYSIHESGEMFLLGFGMRGVFTFFALFPWGLAACTFASIVIFQFLLGRFTTAYRIPILYLFGVSTFGCLLLGLAINNTSFHQLLSEFAEENHHVLIKSWYERVELPDEELGEFRGVVVAIDGDSFIVSHDDHDGDEDDGTRKVIPQEGSKVANITVGDEVYIAGTVEDGVIYAYGIGKLR